MISGTETDEARSRGSSSVRVNSPAVVAGGLGTRLISEINPNETFVNRDDEEDRSREDLNARFFAPELRGPDAFDQSGSLLTEGEEDWDRPSTSRSARRGRNSDGDDGSNSIDAQWATPADEEERAGQLGVSPLAPRPPDSMVAPKTTGKHQNRRLVAVIALVVVFVLAYMVNGQKYAKEPPKDDKQTAVKSQGQPAMQFTSPGDAELGTPNRSGAPFVNPPPPAPVETAPPPPPPAAAPPAPTPAVERPPDEPRFAVKMRAGDEATKESAEESRLKSAQRRAATQSAGKQGAGAQNDERFQRGTRITLQLAEPLRSGIASVVTAQVLGDVVGKDGEVLVPAGSKAAIPFFPGENQGRMLNNISEPAVFITPSGDEVTLYGTVKGSDGFTGITGKVIKVGGPSTLRRVLGGVTRVGERAAGQVLSGAGAAGDIGQEGVYEIDRASGGFSGQLYERSNKIVEVPAGATLTFELSWKAPNAPRR